LRKTATAGTAQATGARSETTEGEALVPVFTQPPTAAVSKWTWPVSGLMRLGASPSHSRSTCVDGLQWLARRAART